MTRSELITFLLNTKANDDTRVVLAIESNIESIPYLDIEIISSGKSPMETNPDKEEGVIFINAKIPV